MAWEGKSGVAIVCDGLTAAGRAVLEKAARRAGWGTEAFAVCRADDVPQGARALVACGDAVLKELTGWAGGKKAAAYTRGYVLPGWSGLPVVPTFDPSKVALGQMKLLGLVMHDLGTALDVARGRRGVCYDPTSVVDYRVGLGALRELVAEAEADPTLLVAFDLETEASSGEDEDEIIEFSRDGEEAEEDGDEGIYDGAVSGHGGEQSQSSYRGSFSRDALDVGRASITTVQFSLRPGIGVSCEWGPEAAELTQRLMALPNSKAGHNSWLFDEPILRAHGVEVPPGAHDTLWMYHHLQPDLPAHLQGVASQYGFPFAWKHLAGPDLAFYGAADVDAVQRIVPGLQKALSRLGLLGGYETYVRLFRPVLAAMERRGIPVSREKLSELRQWLETEVTRMDAELQPLVPPQLHGRHPKEGYANIPDDVRELVVARHPELVAPTIKEYKNGKTREVKSKTTGKDLYRWLFEGPCPDETVTAVAKLGYQMGECNGHGPRLFKEVPFNARSTQQVQALLRARGYPIPTRFKDGKATTGDKELAKLEVRTKDPALGLIRSIKAYSKLGNAYAGKELPDGTIKGGWQPGPDGRLRATVTFGPATWQLAARNPNVMTTPKRRKELAQRFRRCIEAPEGYRLVSFDFKSFHAMTTALEARDPLLMRLSRLDVHSFLAGHLVKFPGIETCTDMSDADLAAYLEEIKARHKPVREFQAKPAVHGTNFGQSARRLYFEYSEHFENQAAANRLLDLYRSLFPRLFAWQEAVVEEADRNGRLVTRWGAVRWFWDAKTWTRRDGRWVSRDGRDADKIKAFKPSNDAHGMFRDKVLQCEEHGWLERYGLINLIHDDTLWLCPVGLVDECVANVRPLLAAPVPQLTDEVMCPAGFTCDVDCSVGRDWATMEGVK